jgi:spore germination cell wall hydrolase CwlJ-like protein
LPSLLHATTQTADTKSIVRPRRQALNYTLEERDYLIRTIAFEAPHETNKGKAAVAHVILNRKKSGRWGDSIKDVVTRPSQFEPWMTRRKEIEELSPNDPRYQSAARIADAVLAGQIPDPTAGATHFLNQVVVRQRRGGSLPSWASSGGLSIGRHTFYSPDEAGAVPQRSAITLIAIASAIFMHQVQSCSSELTTS